MVERWVKEVADESYTIHRKKNYFFTGREPGVFFTFGSGCWMHRQHFEGTTKKTCATMTGHDLYSLKTFCEERHEFLSLPYPHRSRML